MKKILYTLFFTSTLLLTSCSIYEDVYFKQDGQVRYEIKFDASEILAMIPDAADKAGDLPSDSIISVVDLLKQKGGSSKLLIENKEDIENITPLFLEMRNDKANQILTITMFGDFTNVEALNKALISINKLQEKGKKEGMKNSNIGIDRITNTSSFTWDGKTMKRKLDLSQIVNEAAGNKNDMISKMFSQGKMTIKYHFPEKIDKANNSDALISQDGKTVIVEYSASKFLKSDNSLDIEITTKK